MRQHEAFLADAISAIRDLQGFRSKITREEFLEDPLKQSYVFHRLVILGEAAVNLSKVYGQKYYGIPWNRLCGLRNRLVHAYFDLDLELLWGLTQTPLDALGDQLEQLLRTEFPEH